MSQSSTNNTTDDIVDISEPSLENPFDISQHLSNMEVNTTSETSTNNPINDLLGEFSGLNIDDKVDLDYDFVLKLSANGRDKMRLAISALKNAEFNPSKTGLMHVTKSGFSIAVKSTIDSTNDNDYVFGYLRMREDNLLFFKCQNPVTKVVPLRDVLRVLKAADFDSEAVVYCVHGSNQLSFDFDEQIDGSTHDKSIHVNLIDDINSEYEMFPNVLYGYKGLIPAASLNQFVRSILSNPEIASDNTVTLDICTQSVNMEVGEGMSYHKIRQPSVAYNVSWTWRHWWSLSKALCVADIASVYLVRVPAQSVMLKLKLFELGDVVYLHNAQFEPKTEESLPIKGLYRTIS